MNRLYGTVAIASFLGAYFSHAAVSVADPELESLLPGSGVFSQPLLILDKEVRLRKLLLEGQTERPMARVVVTGAAIPSYVITVFKEESSYRLIYCSAVEEPQTGVTADTKRILIEMPLEAEVAQGIQRIWVRGIMEAKYPKIRPQVFGFGRSYYSAFVDKYGLICAMDDAPTKDGSLPSLIGSITGCLRYYVIYPERREEKLKEIKAIIAESSKLNPSK